MTREAAAEIFERIALLMEYLARQLVGAAIGVQQLEVVHKQAGLQALAPGAAIPGGGGVGKG